jgi:hypothetical protein
MVDDRECEPADRVDEGGAPVDPARGIGGVAGGEPRARTRKGDRGELAALPRPLGELEGHLGCVDRRPRFAREERNLDRAPGRGELEVRRAVGVGELGGLGELAASLREIAASQRHVRERPACHRVPRTLPCAISAGAASPMASSHRPSPHATSPPIACMMLAQYECSIESA